jgi:23S rRNA pseudouridine2605 synthase
MTQRLQKILSERGVASRRASEEMIKDGRITVNGRIAALGDSADPETDEILLDGQALPDRQKAVYILLNKPRGFVTTLSDEKGRRTVTELVDCGLRVYPVGRLDMDSDNEGRSRLQGSSERKRVTEWQTGRERKQTRNSSN